jgi:hypothetical protein
MFILIIILTYFNVFNKVEILNNDSKYFDTILKMALRKRKYHEIDEDNSALVTKSILRKLSEKEGNIHSFGYTIIKSAVKVDSSIVNYFKKYAIGKSHTIFNQNETTNRNDYKRRQRNISMRCKKIRVATSIIKS